VDLSDLIKRLVWIDRWNTSMMSSVVWHALLWYCFDDNEGRYLYSPVDRSSVVVVEWSEDWVVINSVLKWRLIVAERLPFWWWRFDDDWWSVIGLYFCFKRDDERVWTGGFEDSFKKYRCLFIL
jgi:hypothetical protein